jgi:KDO2-lipid IV(A) lauroyltransferase
MQRISFLLIMLFVWPVSRIPLPILYLFSNLLAPIFEHVIGYRKQVIYENMKRSFPDKSDEELKEIRHRFYRYFADLIVEGIRSFGMSEQEIRRRFRVDNVPMMKEMQDKGKDVILILGHYNNWEWADLIAGLVLPQPTVVIFKPIKNKYFNNYIIRVRAKFGVRLMATKKTGDHFRNKDREPGAYCFVSDQSPSNPRRAYWTKFLNKDTAVLYGAERYARIANAAIVFVDIQRPKRGFYHATLNLMSETPDAFDENQITEAHIRRLEEQIRKKPEFWLWSHKRWKHKKPA